MTSSSTVMTSLSQVHVKETLHPVWILQHTLFLLVNQTALGEVGTVLAHVAILQHPWQSHVTGEVTIVTSHLVASHQQT